MKFLLVGFILFSVKTHAIATDVHLGTDKCDVHCQSKLEGMPKVPKAVRDIASQSLDGRVSGLGLIICSLCLQRDKSYDSRIKEIKNEITDIMSVYTPIKKPSNKDMVNFLNEHRDKMTCGEDGQYMFHALKNTCPRFLFDELIVNALYDDDALIDINAVQKSETTGRYQTVLDYMDETLARNDIGDDFRIQVKGLRDMFAEEFGAKKYDDLPLAEKRNYEVHFAIR